MNNLEVLIFGLLFAGTAGAAFAFMWRSMGMVREEYNRPKRRIHPEMEDVKSGESLLVFRELFFLLLFQLFYNLL